MPGILETQARGWPKAALYLQAMTPETLPAIKTGRPADDPLAGAARRETTFLDYEPPEFRGVTDQEVSRAIWKGKAAARLLAARRRGDASAGEDRHGCMRELRKLPDAELAQLVGLGEKAPWALSSRAERVIHAVATKFCSSLASSLSKEDLIQCGRAACHKAAFNYNPDRGEFKTLAWGFIHKAILEEVGTNRPAALSRGTMDRIRKVQRRARKFAIEHGREPELHELAKENDLTADEIARYLDLASQTAVSIEAHDGDEHLRHECYTVAANAGLAPKSPFEHVDRNEQINLLRDRLKILDENERQVVRMAYGIGRAELTISDIRKELGLSHHRQIDKILASAFKKLREAMANEVALPG